MHISRIIALGLLAQIPVNPNPLVNGAWTVNRAVGGIDVMSSVATDYPQPGGVSYSVWAGKPNVVYPDHSRIAIPQTSADVLALLKGLPGCNVAGHPLYPAEGVCR